MTGALGLGVQEPADRNGAFPRLTSEQRAHVRAVGEVRSVESGEVLFAEGGGYDAATLLEALAR